MFDPNRAEYVLSFLEMLPFGSGAFAGKPFRLQQWQKDPLREFYGNVDEDPETGETYRHFQYLYEEIPKKNGKTEVAAGLGLYHLVGDGEQNPQVYICAADKENASICYNAMCAMVDARPWLQKRVYQVPSRKEIRLADDSGFIKVLSSEAYSKHGYNASCVIFDELHAQPNRALWDVMTFGAGSARCQPVWIVLTTAGDDPDRKSIGWEIHSQCRKILAARAGTGPAEDDNPIWLPVMYGMPDDPEECAKIDIYDEEVWRRCNPSLGVTIPLRTIRQEAREARQSEAKERLFRWLRLNQWIATKSVGWLPLTLYDRTQWHVPKLEEVYKGNQLRREMRRTLRGKKCYGGLDLATTTDLAAFVLEFPPQPGLDHWVVLFWAWRPREGILDAEKRDHVPYQDWARAEYLSLCDGDMNDFQEIEDTILEASRIYKLACLGVDPYLSRMMSGRLEKAKITVVEIRQNMADMSPAMKDVEVKLRGGEMVHEHNTCARWNFGNTRCATDGNANIKPMKNLSTGRIDITVAWIICHAAAMLAPANSLSERVQSGQWRM
ncbi:MAG: terminase large subunit [Ruminococcaceae bacterium]|nr:terminase large subunit [Oscillospiraceae bacterium]